MTLALIGLVGGLITGVSPCVLPMLPVIFFAGSAAAVGEEDPAEKKRNLRPLVVILGLITSFSVFTLVGTAILSALGLPDSFLRWAGLVVLSLVGLGMLIPALGHLIERPFYRLPKVAGGDRGPFLLGLGLGTLYVPCAGPVLAAITVAGATGHVGARTIVLTIAFATGAAIPLFFFAAAGARIRTRISAYRQRAKGFRIASGVILIALAFGLAFNLTDRIQQLVPDYTSGLQQSLANSSAIQQTLSPFTTDENKDLSTCTSGATTLASCGAAPQLRDTQQWFNTPGNQPISLSQLRGKVVVLDFFAYSCINCQRDQPYLEKWYQAYRDAGLVVIGVHSPEFSFERSATNLHSAIVGEGTTYPVVQDNNLSTWAAYRNRYWPAKYLIDAQGTVRAIRFGEGGYNVVESQIRELLQQANPGVQLPAPVTAQAAPAPTGAQTPETYLAAGRPGYRGSPTYLSTTVSNYALNPAQPQDTYSLGGSWNVSNDSIKAEQNSQIRLHFRATHLYNVLSGQGTVTVEIPGQPTRTVTVSGTPNLYHLFDASTPFEGTATITYSPGIQAYTFSFG